MIADPIPFLANIIVVVHADGRLSASELGELENIRTELNFKKGDFNKALSLVEKKGYQMTPVGSFADQVKNLESMLRVAYSDSDLDQLEGSMVSDFCVKIGLSQEQVNQMATEVLNMQSNRGKLCSSCGAAADADAKFCPSCGISLQSQEPSVPLTYELPESGMAIEFADSTAASFPKALEIAKAADSYHTCQKMGKTWHLAIFQSESLVPALPLVDALSNIRNKRVFLASKETPWDEVFGFAWCASQRNKAYRPVEYCFGKDENRFNPWGCKQARMDWCEWSGWFSYGVWEKAGLLGSSFVWRFDKERIHHELATNLYRSRFCPHLVTGLAQAVLKCLPETVNPSKDKNWVYSCQYEQAPGTIKVVEKEGTGAYSFLSEFWSDGVRPRGHELLAEILTKAFADVGLSAVSAQALLK